MACAHVCILQLKGIIIRPDSCGLITELASGPTLFNFLHHDAGPRTTYSAFEWAKQIVDAMVFVSSRGIVHRELKPHNILLSGTPYICKIGGFGLAQVPGLAIPPAVACAYRWMSPEMMQPDPATPETTATDVYSFAIIFWELLSGQVPFASLMDAGVVFNVLQGRQRPPFTPLFTGNLQMLLATAWDQSPHHRPSFHDIHSRLPQLAAETQNFHALLPIPQVFILFAPPPTTAVATRSLSRILHSRTTAQGHGLVVRHTSLLHL
jgi:serine/threonine protein kinase